MAPPCAAWMTPPPIHDEDEGSWSVRSFWGRCRLRGGRDDKDECAGVREIRSEDDVLVAGLERELLEPRFPLMPEAAADKENRVVENAVATSAEGKDVGTPPVPPLALGRARLRDPHPADPLRSSERVRNWPPKLTPSPVIEQHDDEHLWSSLLSPRAGRGSLSPRSPNDGCGSQPRGELLLSPRVVVTGSPIALHVYDFHELTRKMGLPIYHLAVEVFGREHYFSKEGLLWCRPAGNHFHAHRVRLPMGHTRLSASQTQRLIQQLMVEWPASAYNMLGPNCQTFAVAFLERLGAKSNVPPEYCRFAGSGGLPLSVTETLTNLGGSFLGSLGSQLVDPVAELRPERQTQACDSRLGCHLMRV